MQQASVLAVPRWHFSRGGSVTAASAACCFRRIWTDGARVVLPKPLQLPRRAVALDSDHRVILVRRVLGQTRQKHP